MEYHFLLVVHLFLFDLDILIIQGGQKLLLAQGTLHLLASPADPWAPGEQMLFHPAGGIQFTPFNEA